MGVSIDHEKIFMCKIIVSAYTYLKMKAKKNFTYSDMRNTLPQAGS